MSGVPLKLCAALLVLVPLLPGRLRGQANEPPARLAILTEAAEFSTVAYLLVNQLRRVGLAGTELAQATCGTIRVRLLKIGAVVQVTARRVWVSLCSAFPLQELFAEVAGRLITAT